MYCIKCGRETKNSTEKCRYCGEPLLNKELTHEETRALNQSLHNRLNKSRQKVDSEMVFIVLGLTFLVVGILFFMLSFKLQNAWDIDKTLTVTCFEFWVSLAGLSVGGIMFIWGLINLLIQKLKVQKEINRTLAATQSGTYDHLTFTSKSKK